MNEIDYDLPHHEYMEKKTKKSISEFNDAMLGTGMFKDIKINFKKAKVVKKIEQ